MNIGLNIDLRRFNAAMKDYVDFTGKTMATALNRQMKDVAYRAASFVQPADRNELGLWKALGRKDPGGFISPLVAYLLKNKKSKLGAFSTIRTAVWYEGKHVVQGGEFYTRKEAKEFGKRVFASRYRAITFLKAFFVAAAKRFVAVGVRGGGSSIAGIREIPQIKVNVKTATADSPEAGFLSRYLYKRKRARGEGATRLLRKALRAGLQYKTNDMRKYIADELAKKAAQISGARAA